MLILNSIGLTIIIKTVAVFMFVVFAHIISTPLCKFLKKEEYLPTIDKIAVIIYPIAAFVLLNGFLIGVIELIFFVLECLF